MYAQSEQIARCDERILIKNRLEMCTQCFNKIQIRIRGKENQQNNTDYLLKWKYRKTKRQINIVLKTPRKLLYGKWWLAIALDDFGLLEHLKCISIYLWKGFRLAFDYVDFRSVWLIKWYKSYLLGIKSTDKANVE